MELIPEIQKLLGAPPAGYEWLQYLFVGVLLILMIDSCITFVSGLLRWVGGYR